MIAAIHQEPWLGIAIVAASVAVLLLMLTVVRRLPGTSAEGIRKLFHIGVGLVALSLPHLFDALWPVLVVSLASAVALLLIRTVGVLREGPGQVLQAVARRSLGEFWFVLGVVVAFIIAGDRPVTFSIGILTLAIADATAALVGVVYGRHRFDVPGGTKSAEGSIAFFMVAFLCVHIPILLFTSTGRQESLMIALNVGLLVMFAEASVARGADNFVLPVLVVVLLDVFEAMPALQLCLHAGVIVILGILIMTYKRRTTLSGDALIGAVLAAYICWSFGDWRWLVSPLTLFFTYTWLVGRPQLESDEPFHSDVLLALVAPGVVLVTMYAELGNSVLYAPFVASWAANLAVIGTLHSQLRSPDSPPLPVAFMNSVKALVVLAPGLLVWSGLAPAERFAAVASIPAALLFFAFIGRDLRRSPTSAKEWFAVPVSVAFSIAVCFGIAALVPA